MSANRITDFESALLAEIKYPDDEDAGCDSSYPGDWADCREIDQSMADTYGKVRVWWSTVSLFVRGMIGIRDGKLALSKHGEDALMAFEAAAWDYPQIV